VDKETAHAVDSDTAQDAPRCAAVKDQALPRDVAGGTAPDALRGRSPDVAREKAAMRARLRAARAAMTPAQRSAAGRVLRDGVLSLPEAEMAGTVAAYFSMGAEPDTRGLVYALWKRGSYVLLPVLRDDWDLDWASYEGPDSVRPRADGRYGLAEPVEPPRGPGAIARAALVIVPALAVDGRGARLGQGGGCYDRALARVSPAVPTVALVYENELVERVPCAPHDQKVRLVARPRGDAAELLRLPL
jgi:5-formyltetrahydrofolate cyclo-ligase